MEKYYQTSEPDIKADLSTESNAATRIEDEILKLIPHCRFTGSYEHNGVYTVYNPGSFVDNICRERKAHFLV